MAKNAFQIHEAFASLMGLSDRVVWDMYNPLQFSVFEEKLNQIIVDYFVTNPQSIEVKKKIRDTIFERVKLQTKYTNKNLLASFILVTVATGTRHQEAKDATKFSLHLIVRMRKCINYDDSTNCCMIFIDDAGNVYNNWKHFMASNTLPSGIALAPANGYYTFENGRLNIDSWKTHYTGWSGMLGAILPILPILPLLPVLPGNIFESSSNSLHYKSKYVWTETVVNEMTISSVLLSGTESGNLVFDIIKTYHDAVKASSLKTMKTATSLLVFTHSIYNFRLALKIANRIIDFKEVNRLQRASQKKFFKEGDQADQIRLLNEIPDRPFLNGYHDDDEYEIVFVSDINGSIFRKYTNRRLALLGNIILPTTVKHIFPQNDRTLLSLASTHPLTKHAFSEKSCELIEYLTAVFDYNSVLIINEDCLQDCVQYLINYLGEATAQLLIEKTRDFIKHFKGVIEKLTKTKLCAEIVLWDLYKQCEEHVKILTVEVIEKEMPTLLEELFFYYERMACSSNSVPRIKCTECNGFYQEHSIN